MERVWETDKFNKWWLDPFYGPTGNLLSNVRIGDLFSLHTSNQFGLVKSKTMNVGVDIKTYYSYEIAGDIGGHWYHPNHDWLRDAGFARRGEAEAEALARVEYGCGYARFMPNATQLAELGEMEWAMKLLDWYKHHPFASTQRGDLAREKRRKEKADGLEK
jgi:hypothetical protein